jgi:hypothetical protein
MILFGLRAQKLIHIGGLVLQLHSLACMGDSRNTPRHLVCIQPRMLCNMFMKNASKSASKGGRMIAVDLAGHKWHPKHIEQ